MKVLLFGSDGFIGSSVYEELNNFHKVIRATRVSSENNDFIQVDLLDESSVKLAIDSINPDVIINCAGIVDTTLDTDLNIQFTKNILEQLKQPSKVKKVIICGSAGEYGPVASGDIPVNEYVKLSANSGYGFSKLKEELFALEYGKENDINVIVLRIFNPIGRNMAERFLLMRLMQQVDEFKQGKRQSLEVARLDAKRDYVSVKDIASAFRYIIEGDNKEHIYNIGSGISTTNGELLEKILDNYKLDNIPKIIETSNEPESLVAVQADIRRISDEFGWKPKYTVDDVISEICLS